ncbi:hypothetical protein CFIO01_01458 [Colletotrichum fioriniae PJ7]|uniref:Uncharacterized protein n=1 Tax=Colletotrichum fioriniae PJ7 TaxID=1445577 RepID=A0A010RT47_9PEZI|nr:hypothetical protein CFIO01_01458 [Colletotrichum fioriniae PJ7]
MKATAVLAFAVLAPNAVSAWMCNCRSSKDAQILVALKFCGTGPGHTRCYNPTTKVQACIMNTPITQADCDAKYGGKGEWIAQCEHWTGACPPGSTQD